MADFAKIALKFWKNKKARNITFLTILIMVMFFCLKSCYVNINQNRNIVDGATRTYICPKCEFTGKMVITDLGKISCPKCQTKVGYAWKCKNCQREFAVKNSKTTKLMSKKELEEKKRNEGQCPNCQSFNTSPLIK